MDLYEDKIRENLHEDYSKKKFVEKPKHRVLRYLMIPFGIIILFIIGANIFMSVNNFDLIIEYSQKFDVDPAMVASIIYVESKYNEEAVSPKNAVGLMQITEDTFTFANESLKLENTDFSDLTKGDVNIYVGTWYYSYLLNEFNGNIQNTLCAYNAGPNKVKEWQANEDYCFDGENLYIIPYQETRLYVHKVNTVYPIFKTLIELRLF